MNDRTKTPPRALTRRLSATFRDALTMAPPEDAIDLALASRQHAAYVDVLRSLGVEVVELPALDAFPDGCFVEDCALVAGGVALITSLGAPSRRGEERTVRDVLAGHLQVASTELPATIDGGDCLVIERRIHVGRSARTNALGAARIRELFGPLGFEVVEVEVAGVLHLKSAATYLGRGKLALAEGAVAPEVFGDVEIVTIPAEEGYAANCLAIGGTVLVAAGFPEAQRRIAAAGFATIALDMSEMRKADGALTCCSVFF